MIDLYDREERIAIRQFCGNMSEKMAIELTDADELKPTALAQRIAKLAQHQRENARPTDLRAPLHEPVHDRKSMAAGDCP